MEKTKGHILISGASIAGPCLAYWLTRAGFRTTVIERAPKFREGGQNVDVSGVGRTIADFMGLLERIKAHNTTEVGLKFVDSDNNDVAQFPKNGDDSFTSEYEIRRGDLSRLFFEATKDQTTYRFGTSIESVQDSADSIRVKFADGSTEDFDLVVCAEGVGSTTRSLVLRETTVLKYLGIWMGYFRIPKIATDDHWCRWYNAPGGRVIMMRPSTPESEAVTVGFRSRKQDPPQFDVDEQRAAIAKVLNGAGWKSDRIKAGLDFDDDMYVGPISQVKAQTWSKGRFVLVGDAAYGPSPITGMGTTMAIIGAYILAGEIAKGGAQPSSLQSYERILKPYANEVQELPPGVPRLVYPRSEFGVALVRTGARIFGSSPIRYLRQKLSQKKGAGRKRSGEFVLPDYQSHFRSMVP